MIRSFVLTVSVGSLLTACGGPPSDAESPSPEDADMQAASGRTSLSVPVVTIACVQDTYDVNCSSSVTGGVPPYTYYWGERIYIYLTKKTYNAPFHTGGSEYPFPCSEPGAGTPWQDIDPRVYVIDATGARSATASAGWYSCL
ncbi:MULTISPECIES: hypothetical protein [unclassified Corallococcus]|uniref:hypothetical protein n=1 Tax=unclassified Corallococcus TaxID=2685029 RepID=UPI001A8F32F8|nr:MULTISPECIES: hypothetical protein [unclassified Corallococcus]MBN9685902.1 hypothetical protein [Corallococcus sp. NCSPR001]WAS82658.1 hypothetical protein O0N60_25420 [Corallococcus sp. NCRR]